MQEDFASRLLKALSTERLAGYGNRLGDSSHLNLFSHYAWNIVLAESLYPSLQILEVALRNAIHSAASEHFGRADWYDDPRAINSRDRDTVQKAKDILSRDQKPTEPGRVVAELNFGFWTTLLDKRYEQVLWPALLKPCFPHMPRSSRTRKEVSKRFQAIRTLRNRVFHHEPIWYWRDLSEKHTSILEAMAWIEPATRDLVEVVDHFPEVYGGGFAEFERRLKQFCG